MVIDSMKLKRAAVCLAIAAFALGAGGGCSRKNPAQDKIIEQARAAQQETQQEQGAQEAGAEEYASAGLEPLEEGDRLREAAEYQLPAIAQILAYKGTFPDSFDESAPASDDLWTCMAMAVHALPPEGAVDANGISHVLRDTVAGYASCLLPGFEEGAELPSFDGVYGISADPGSQKVDMEGLEIKVEASLLLLGRDVDTGDIIMRVRIEDAAGVIKMTDWDCAVSEGPRDGALPLVIERFYCVNDIS